MVVESVPKDIVASCVDNVRFSFLCCISVSSLSLLLDIPKKNEALNLFH
jgi:hypothetical protein